MLGNETRKYVGFSHWYNAAFHLEETMDALALPVAIGFTLVAIGKLYVVLTAQGDERERNKTFIISLILAIIAAFGWSQVHFG
jgi:ABC-type spermidine/putrescine transport system permease subunit II